MKKSIIAASASAVALAAMPALGAFADVTDTVVVTIPDACSVGQTSSSQTGGGVTVTESNAANEHLYTWDADGTAGGTLKVSCNDASGWQVKAVGASTGTPVTSMAASGSGTPIVTGTATSGATSNWAFKVAGTTGVDVVSTYTNYAAVPATATKVAGGNGAVSEGTIYTGYQVWVSATQQADTYTGKVTYTITHPNS
ncbi:hypothetical protein IKF12_02055 [Candidatus Saccharibacteria bacterium]|nr:hypothetical protein [Candidatus Saccharibacteria bacterium]MBR3143965.1 hypothetical protein [Candidatus Saccharibacteria bacterium]